MCTFATFQVQSSTCFLCLLVLVLTLHLIAVLEDVMLLDLPPITNVADKYRANALVFTFGCFEIAVDLRKTGRTTLQKSCLGIFAMQSNYNLLG